MFVSGVNDTTPATKGKNFEVYIFSYIVKGLVECTLLDFCLIFKFICRQADIGSTVLVTPAKNLTEVSLTLVNSFQQYR